jgi:hypothetical protein
VPTSNALHPDLMPPPERLAEILAAGSREAIADGYNTCAVTSVSAADVEGALLDHSQKMLAAPELVARTWRLPREPGRRAAPARREEHSMKGAENRLDGSTLVVRIPCGSSVAAAASGS